jgi:hypothetical protein
MNAPAEKEDRKMTAIPEKPKGEHEHLRHPSPEYVPFNKHFEALRDRLAYLEGRMKADPDATGYGYWKSEAKAISWALAIVEGELAKEQDLGGAALKQHLARRGRVRSDLQAEFKLFLDFIDWQAANPAEDEKLIEFPS